MPLDFVDTPQYNMYHLIISVFYYVYDLLTKLGQLYLRPFNNEKLLTNAPPAPPNETQLFCERRAEQFIRLFDEAAEKSGDVNANIGEVFGDKAKYKETMEIYDNEVEKEWKRRILMDTTPRGNVMMYYDPYKLAFAYLADNFIPYAILNGVAMKYVKMYKCRDFFVDEFVVPEGKVSCIAPLIRSTDEKPDAAKVNGGIDKKTLDSAPFAKLKSYNQGSLAASQTPNSARNMPSASSNGAKAATAYKKQQMNTFVYLGKTSNLSLIQKTPRQNTLNGFHTSLVNSKKISWSQFKETGLKK